MSYIVPQTGYQDVGQEIYMKALDGRSGFDFDFDDEIWEEIFEELGKAAVLTTTKILVEYGAEK